MICNLTAPNSAHNLTTPKRKHPVGCFLFGATGRTCKEPRKAATKQRLFADRRNRVTSFRQSGQWPKRCPRTFVRGRVWSYWPDLNRRPFVTPKKCAARKPVEWARLFLGTPYGLIFGLTDSNSAHKPKKKAPAVGVLSFWSYWPDLNRRPADYESAALPATEPQ